MQLVLSIGDSLDSKQISSLPANCIVVNRTPQIELLKRAALCITHAGLNTVLESLTHGLPMVAIPVTNDQPAEPTRMPYNKTLTHLPIHTMSTSRLSHT